MAQSDKKKPTKSDRQHVELMELGYEHEPVGDYDGGKCLARCCGYYDEGNSCSYRWQAVKRARDDYAAMYQGASEAKRYRTLSERYANMLLDLKDADGASAGLKNEPSKDGPRSDKKLCVSASGPGSRFITGWYPWVNNAHHIVPVAVIRDAILRVPGQIEKRADVAQAIMTAFMAAPYNVNHWKNMVILPCKPRVAKVLGLPMHPPRNHSEYSKAVDESVFRVFSAAFESYVEAVKNGSKEDHAAKEATKDVAKEVIAIQEKIYAEIMSNKDARKDTALNINDYDVSSALSR